MDKKRLKDVELPRLAELCENLLPRGEDRIDFRWDLDEGWIELRKIRFPDGWQPRIGAIRYELPATYPVGQPKAFIPETMRYQGETPRIMMTYGGGPGWRKHCIHKFADQLDPNYDTLVSMTRLIYRSLKQPNSNNPFKKVGSRRRWR